MTTTARTGEGTQVAEVCALGEAQGARPLAALPGPPLAGQMQVGPDDVVVLPYSSGTTGMCKGSPIATRSFLVPPIVLALARQPLVDKFDLGALTWLGSGAALLKADLAAACGGRLGCEVSQGYGMTELSPTSHGTPPGGFKPGSAGVTVPNTQTRIVDPVDGADLGTSQDGEIWVRGPQVMKGYFHNPQATAANHRPGGWLHTGDLGHIDADGHLYVTDRLKELIKYKAFQVAPAELEAILLRHPDVTGAAVAGLPDEEAGEIPAGCVTLRPGAPASPEEIRQFVASQVAGYRQLRRLEIIEAIPKSASGKIQRRVLRDAAAAQAGPPA